MAKKRKGKENWREPIHAEVSQAEQDFTVMPETGADVVADAASTVPGTGQEAEATPMATPAAAPEVQINVGTSAQEPTTPAAPTDEDEMNQFYDFDIDDIAGNDPEMQAIIKELKADATTDMKPSHKVAMAIMALGNPAQARASMAEHKAKKGKAQQTLLNLGTGLMKQRQETQKQIAIADRATQAQIASSDKSRKANQARADLALKKMDQGNKRDLLQVRVKALSDNYVPSQLVVPTNLDDDAAFNEYMIKSMEELTFGEKANQAIGLWEEYSAAQPDTDPDVAEDSFRTLMLTQGLQPDMIEKMLQGYGPRIRALAKQAGKEMRRQEAADNASLEAMQTNLRVNEMRILEIEAAIKTNDYAAQARLSDEVVDMGNEYRQLQGEIAKLELKGAELNERFEQSEAELGDMSAATYYALSAENQRRRDGLTKHMARTDYLYRTAQKRLALSARKREFSAYYNQTVDITIEELQLENPMATPEEIIQTPEYVKRLSLSLKLEYPGMSIQDIQSAVNKDKMERAAMNTPGAGLSQQYGAEAPLIETGTGIDPGMLGSAARYVPGGEQPGGTSGSEKRSQFLKDNATDNE